ncbi:MAG TPA: hypothetical protein VEI06_07000 [Gemmatimonadaceae bacterium]|nr:hypothetical protein [Gemmatimonadaceae bacterium]
MTHSYGARDGEAGDGAHHDPEAVRLDEDTRRIRNWKRWGPYLSERQWGTVREDYSANGAAWEYFPHDHARSRTYRWGEDGLLGITDRQCRLCFALALWNGRDPILKERLFGLTNSEGNHGEDVKECYYYLESTPTHSYMKALYKYPQAEFPYGKLVAENRRRRKSEGEYELLDTGVFDEGRYFDVFAEYAKAAPDDILIRLTVANRGPDEATLHLLPTLWLRNTWFSGRTGDSYWPRGTIAKTAINRLRADHPSLGRYILVVGPGPNGVHPPFLFTDNETNFARLFAISNPGPYVKDSFHDYLVDGRDDALNPASVGTKAAAHYILRLGAGGAVTLRLRLTKGAEHTPAPLDDDFDRVFADRQRESEEFYRRRSPPGATEEERRVLRQGYAGLLWSKQFYNYVVREWQEGDPAMPPPPPSHAATRNARWEHLYNRDVLSMPDVWEFPWYASWDLAFHCVAFARIDPEFAKQQLLLLMREWYMNPSGQIPAYEWSFDDVNPPVHAWAVYRVYKMAAPAGHRDRLFLERAFHKLLLNFTWWVNRKDLEGKHLFAGGFLGLDNIGVFDRSRPLPGGAMLEQADATAWMAFFCLLMLMIAGELGLEDPAYEDVASKFFEHFVAIVDAMNSLGGTGLWSEQDGFYYDMLHLDGQSTYLALRSMVGIIPLFVAALLPEETLTRFKGFAKRTEWFLKNRVDLAQHIAYMETATAGVDRLLAVPSRERLVRVLRRVLDESEFLSPHGVRSLSRAYATQPYALPGLPDATVRYSPGESETELFGGNSNWRGPVWVPLNYLLIEGLESYHRFYGDSLRVECPTGSGQLMTLQEVARDLTRRLATLVLPDAHGARPCHGGESRYATDAHWKDLVLFYEFFHGDTGRGCGANHQTGWTALLCRCIEDVARDRAAVRRAGGDSADVSAPVSGATP